MCGIAGVFQADPITNLREIELMVQALQYRGPDDKGIFRTSNLALGHARLSILDLSPAGHQPMQNSEGTVTVVFNGEIYNTKELQTELSGKGFRFRGHSDTEVLLNAYLDCGMECLKRFQGMFAFAIWDSRIQTLYLVRDRMGEKPLYYFFNKKRLAFASELPALRRLDWIPFRIEPAKLLDFLYHQYIPGAESIFQGIRRLEPGHFLCIQLKNNSLALDNHMYWELSPVRLASTDIPEERVEGLLRTSIRQRMIADVDVGVLLSGGKDSSLIAALASQESTHRLKTFSVSFAGESFDEQQYARMMADKIDSEHYVLSAENVTPALFEKVLTHMDEPLGDPACIPTYMIAARAVQHVKTCLAGEGADELFGGYPFYHLDVKYNWLWNLLADHPRMAHWLSCLPHPLPAERHLRRIARVMANKREAGSARWTQVFNRIDIARFCHPSLCSMLSTYDPLLLIRSVYEKCHANNCLGKTMATDLLTWLPDDLLVKADRMTMAHSLELRTPYLDHELVEVVMGLPLAQKITSHEQKIILRRIAAKYVPEAILKRPKHGFEVPLDRWLLTNLREPAEEVFNSNHLQASGIFNSRTVAAEWDFMKQKGRSRYPRRMWVMFTLLHWLKHYGYSL